MSKNDLSENILYVKSMDNSFKIKHLSHIQDVIIDRWDTHHVKLPSSNANELNAKRWLIIVESLQELHGKLAEDQNSEHIEYTIKKYNQKFENYWDFKVLHYLMHKEYDDQEKEEFLSKVIPNIINLALKLPNLFTQPIPLLKQKMNLSLEFTQEQLASLLANAFFCTFPCRNNYDKEDNHREYDKFPSINFDTLLCTYKQGGLKIKLEKLKCIMNYFKRVTQSMPNGLVTFTRRCANEFPLFDKSNAKIVNCEIRFDGTIEDCDGTLHMDFANKYIGGGVLSRGCVQEEIRFLLCPELLVSCLFCEVMLENECILIKGFERFNSYKGYSSTFKWYGDFIDTTQFDTQKQSELLAVDALHYFKRQAQYSIRFVTRELKKAFCGFKFDENQLKDQKLATGNWGCGAFNGDVQLKFLIQLIAASECNREMIYFTFGNQAIYRKLKQIYDIIKLLEFTNGQVLTLVKEYCKEACVMDIQTLKNFTLHEFFKTKFDLN